MSKGWISVHRQIQDHWVWKDKPFSKGQAWLDILMMVNHEDARVLLGNELVEVKRGSRITSIRQLCDRWGWSNTKVKKFLSVLESDNMLVVKSDTKKTTLTIVNYNDYQESKNIKNDTETTEKRHGNDTETSQKHTNNNDNNNNNENNLLLLSISKEFPNFYKWIEENNYTKEAEHPNDKPYYLKYLHEKANFYSKTKGKEHPDTINAIKAFENKKAIETEEIILKAQSIG